MPETIYQRLFGLKRVINASGTMTALGGSLMPPEAVEAMAEAAQDWVELPSLLERAGETIAQIAQVEAACVTSGSAAGMTLAAAACIAGHDRQKIERLPDTEGLPNQNVIQRGQVFSFARCFRSAGARVIEVGGDTVVLSDGRRVLGVTPAHVEEAINEQTVALAVILSHGCVQDGLLPPAVMGSVAHAHDLPLIVDAASELPPVRHLRELVDLGGDLVIFSGGKAIGGPNDTGFILGRRDLVSSCALQANPHVHIGRGLKVSKEQIVALVVALQRYASQDFDALLAQEMARAEYVIQKLAPCPFVDAHLVFPGESGLPVPRVRLILDEEALGMKAEDVLQALRAADPAIYLRPGYESVGILTVDVQVLRDGEERIVVERLKEQLACG
jgi:L-seryl-tRNA(Ser) seleniumtransferase/D-glucosaminate-6-phosphate ammonia-lyase